MALIAFFGARGSGKTTSIYGQLDNLQKPVVIIDILGNDRFQNTVDEDENQTGRFVMTYSIGECMDEMVKYHEDENHSGLIVCRATDYNDAADWISSQLWKLKGGTLVVDEGDSISMAEAPCFDENIRFGRNRGISLIFGCRRPAEISPNVRANANKIYVFRTHEPLDVKYFVSIFGREAEQLTRLPQFHGLFIDYDKGQIGKFYIDIDGHIFHTEARSIHGTVKSLDEKTIKPGETKCITSKVPSTSPLSQQSPSPSSSESECSET